jgi:hypothetical protein
MRDSRERTNAVNALDMRVDVLSERRELADTSLEPIHRIDELIWEQRRRREWSDRIKGYTGGAGQRVGGARWRAE